MEQLKALLETEEGKAEFSALVKEMGYLAPDEFSGLKNKNDELLGKYVQQKNKLKELEKTLDSIDVDEYIALKESAGNQPQGGTAAKVEREISALKKALEKIEAEKTTYKSQYESQLLSSSLSSALDKANIDNIHKELLLTAYKSKAKIEDGSVYIDADGLPKTPEEYFSEWTQTEQGKAYIRKPENTGANAPRFSGNAGTKTQFTRAELHTPENRKAYLEAAKNGTASIKE
jgi:hypothetical protein